MFKTMNDLQNFGFVRDCSLDFYGSLGHSPAFRLYENSLVYVIGHVNRGRVFLATHLDDDTLQFHNDSKLKSYMPAATLDMWCKHATTEVFENFRAACLAYEAEYQAKLTA